MNNAKLTADYLHSFNKDDPTGPLEEREATLVKIIDAIKAVAATREWSSLKTLIFDGRLEDMRKQLFHEARKDHPDLLVLAKLNGKYEEVRRYADLLEFAKSFQAELTNIRVKLHGKSES